MRKACDVRRGLYNLAAVFSLMLCVATVVIWVASYFATPQWSMWHGRMGQAGFGAWRGTFWCGTSEPLDIPPEATDMAWANARPMKKSSWGGFGYQSGEDVSLVNLAAHGTRGFVSRYDHVFGVMFPAWAVVLVTGLLPAKRMPRWISALRARQRGARGLCPGCGYDLRATPERCPECGRDVA